TALGVWMRESPSLLAFPTVLFLHTLGLGMLVGVNAALLLWLLAVGRRIGERAASGLTRVMWAGFGVNAAAGVLLLLAYPARALTSPVFYWKLGLIAGARATFAALRLHAFAAAEPATSAPSGRARALAAVTLALWAGAIVTGRLLAYTHSVLMVFELER